MRIDRSNWLSQRSPAFRLMAATSWLAPDNWRAHQEAAIREAIDHGPDWNEYVALVDRHRTPVLSWAALQRLDGLELPQATRLALERRSSEARMHALRFVTLLPGPLRCLELARIPVLALKGPLLSQQIYGDFAMRQSHDLDLACNSKDLLRACLCLQSAGWVRDAFEATMTPRQSEQCLRYEHHTKFVHAASGCYLELHWKDDNLTAWQVDSWWRHSSPAEWQGCAYRTMRSDDLAFYLSMHGSRHAWARVKWLGDLARLQTMGALAWNKCMDRAVSEKQMRILLSVRELLRILYGLDPGPCELEQSPPLLLIDWPLRAMARMEVENWRLGELLPAHRHRRMIAHEKGWGEIMRRYLYSHQDYEMLPLPDRWFWLYVPLRPVLWILRRCRTEMQLAIKVLKKQVDGRRLKHS